MAVRIARKGIESTERLGRHRWGIERTMSWLTGYHRLAIRYDRKGTHYPGFLTLAATLTCFKKLTKAKTPCETWSYMPLIRNYAEIQADEAVSANKTPRTSCRLTRLNRKPVSSRRPPIQPLLRDSTAQRSHERRLVN